MPIMQIEIYDRLVDVELNQAGEVMGYQDAITEEPITYLYDPDIQNHIVDFMNNWYDELEDYKHSRGRDRLNDE